MRTTCLLTVSQNALWREWHQGCTCQGAGDVPACLGAVPAGRYLPGGVPAQGGVSQHAVGQAPPPHTVEQND